MFLASMKAGDTGFIWYSGHGTLLATGENAWVPIDYGTSGFLGETWFLQKLQWLPEGARLFIGSDACHSGSMMNLKFDIEPLGQTLETRRGSFKNAQTRIFSTQGIRKEIQVQAPEFLRLKDEYAVYDVFPSAQALRADVVVLAGCMDLQTSADAFLAGESQGAMTYSFLQAYRALGNSACLGSLQDHMRQSLKNSGFRQVPQLSIGSKLAPNSTLKAFGL
jgi:hypothetical protein